MKKLFLRLALGVFALCLVSVQAETIEEMLSTPIQQYKATHDDILISRKVEAFLSKEHYSAHSITPAVSSDWFKEFFNTLDSQHLLFLQSDIDEFRSYETILWNITRNMANVDFAYSVYSRFLLRLHERVEYSIKLIDSEFDFTEKESLIVDMKDEQPPASPEEQKLRWKKLVKNEILSFIMDEEKAVRKEAERAKEGKPAKTRKTLAEEKEKLKKIYARAYKRRAESDNIKVLEIFLNALTRTYDPHTAYMAPVTKANFDIDISQSLQGIGATLTEDDSYTKVVEIVPGGPAAKDGRLKKGDRIIAVTQEGKDPVDVVDMPLDKVVSQIRGPKGTKVTLTVISEGSNEENAITITRDEIILKESTAKSDIIDVDLGNDKKGRVLVMYLPSFYCDFAAKFSGRKDYNSTTRDMLKLLEDAKATQPLDGVVLDLRGNGGGALEEAIALTGLFIPDGPVVQVRENSGKVTKRVDPDNDIHFAGPLIVMVDKGSASASEILAAALQDYGRAIIVGDKKTHGKGTVQTSIDLARSMNRFRLPNVQQKQYGSLKMTIAKFYRINGGSTQIKGVSSDIVFPSVLDHLDTTEDKLPHVLPWDEIRPLNFNRYFEVEKILPALKEKSAARCAASEEYKAYLKTIEVFKKFHEIKEIPLEINERREFVRQREEADKILKDFWLARKNKTRAALRAEQNAKQEAEEEGNEDSTDSRDIILDETLNIMADYIREVQK